MDVYYYVIHSVIFYDDLMFFCEKLKAY